MSEQSPQEWQVRREDTAIALITENGVIRFDRLPGRVVLVQQVADLYNAATTNLREELERMKQYALKLDAWNDELQQKALDYRPINDIRDKTVYRGPECDYDPSLEVPAEIIEAAHKVANWATKNGLRDWAIGPVADRRLVEKVRQASGTKPCCERDHDKDANYDRHPAEK